MSLQVAKNIVQQRTDVLLPYARNSRTHSDEQVAQIAASIREFGFTNPVLVDADTGKQATLESTGQPFPAAEAAEAA